MGGEQPRAPLRRSTPRLISIHFSFCKRHQHVMSLGARRGRQVWPGMLLAAAALLTVYRVGLGLPASRNPTRAAPAAAAATTQEAGALTAELHWRRSENGSTGAPPPAGPTHRPPSASATTQPARKFLLFFSGHQVHSGRCRLCNCMPVCRSAPVTGTPPLSPAPPPSGAGLLRAGRHARGAARGFGARL